MASTAGDGIEYPGEDDVVAPLEEWLERLALSTQHALDIRPKAMHREFVTTRAAQPDTGNFFQTFSSEDEAARTTPTFGYTYEAGTGANQGSWTLDDGIYLFNWFGYFNRPVTARTVAEISTLGDGSLGNVLARATITSGEDRVQLVATLRMTTGQRLWLRTNKSNGVTETISGRFRITRLGAL